MSYLSFQAQVSKWLVTCFGAKIAQDCIERNHRFLEESLELVQSCGCTASEAHQLVDYVFSRPIGDKGQECGGVMITLASLCYAQNISMRDMGEKELERIWNCIELISKKHANKPKNSPLPQMTTVSGVSPSVPIETLSNGAKQSVSPYRPELLPPKAILAVAAVLKQGAEKYGDQNWRGIPISDNLSHALTHIFAYIAGDTTDEHLKHAACRILFATELDIEAKEKPGKGPSEFVGPTILGNTSTTIGHCQYCGGKFSIGESIHQLRGKNYHFYCVSQVKTYLHYVESEGKTEP